MSVSNNKNNSIDDYIFDFVYVAAMRDATMQLAYTGNKKGLWNPTKGDEGTVNTIKEYLRGHVLEILDGKYSEPDKTEEDYSASLLALSKTICGEINYFTFGNAQKLINMTVKYFYITTFGEPEKRKCFRYCHCPVDGKMLNKVWNDKIKKENHWRSDDFQAAWSKEDFDVEDKSKLPTRYSAFQKAVRALVG